MYLSTSVENVYNLQSKAKIKSKIASPKKLKRKLNRSAINIIRTTQRNNIELKHIADNKANILLSINALIITILIPVVMTHLDFIHLHMLYVPLFLFGLTSFVTLMFSSLVLLPFFERGKKFKELSSFREASPFFFENYEKMNVNEYYNYFCETIEDEELFFKCVVEDLHYYGRIISLKFRQVKIAFIIFIGGMNISAIAAVIAMIFY